MIEKKGSVDIGKISGCKAYQNKTIGLITLVGRNTRMVNLDLS